MHRGALGDATLQRCKRPPTVPPDPARVSHTVSSRSELYETPGNRPHMDKHNSPYMGYGQGPEDFSKSYILYDLLTYSLKVILFREYITKWKILGY